MNTFLWMTAVMLLIGLIPNKPQRRAPFIYTDCIADSPATRLRNYEFMTRNMRESSEFLQREAHGIILKKRWVAPKAHR